MHAMLPRATPPDKGAGSIADQTSDPRDLFAELVAARQRHDAAAGRRLTVALRRAGWYVVPVLPLDRLTGRDGR